MTDAAPWPVLVLVRDLLFASRISATARDLGVLVRMLREPSQLAPEAGQRLIVDLNLPGAIDAAGAWRTDATTSAGRYVIGFVSHTDAVTISAARAAGIDRVMARSQFVQQLPELLIWNHSQPTPSASPKEAP